MGRIFIRSLFVFFFGFSLSVAEENSNKLFVFSSEAKAKVFVEEQNELGKVTNLTNQKHPKKRYFVLLKGYKQWAPAFRQAQIVMKQGFSDVEVTKGRFERDYSVLVSSSLDKKKAGKAFNRLKGLGLRNIKVHTDVVSQYRYIVTVRTPIKIKPENIIVKPAVAKHVPPKPEVQTVEEKPVEVTQKIVLPEKIESPIIMNSDDFNEQDEETIVIVMSDMPEMTYEIDIDDIETDNTLEYGASFNLEEELFNRSAQDVNHTEYVHGDAYIEKQLNGHWDIKLSARVDGTYQRGKHSTDYSDTELDYGDSYIRYRNESFRITAGAQTIRWGKVDNLGPLDNMATLDLSRGILPKWGENYRSSPAIRIESFFEQSKLDFVYLPEFREAELSNKEDVWYPIDFKNGRMLGFQSSPVMSALLPNAKIDDDISGDGGFGLRYSTIIDSFDIGLTVQRVRLSTPYYRINETIRQTLLTNPANALFSASNVPYTFKEEHPRNWVIGADAAFDWKSVTWRMEAGFFSDLPATTTSLEYKTYKGFRWAGSAEFYPGDSDTRVNLQLSGRHIDEKEKIVDLDNVVALSGEIESLFANNRWKVSGRFNIGLSDKDYLLSPEIAFLGWEPFEIYTAYHYLDGAEQTVGGFYKNNSMLTFGFRGKY